MLSALLLSCATQPAPECQVHTGNPVTGSTNYLGVLTRTSTTGTCTDALATIGVSLARFGGAGAAPFGVGLRASRPVDIAQGTTFGVPRVDSTDPNGTKLTVKSSMPRYADDQGLCKVADVTLDTTFDAVNSTLADGGTLTLPALPVKLAWTDFHLRMGSTLAGTVFTAKLGRTEGACTETYDVTGLWPEVSCLTDIDCAPSRVETLLTNGKRVSGDPGGDGGLRIPDAGITTYSRFVGGNQTFGIATRDGTLLRFEDNTVAVLDSNGLLLQADGGLQPAAPNTGSGINPLLRPSCNTSLGVCVPTADVSKL